MTRIDVAAVKRVCPLAAVATQRYGVQFRPTGRRRLMACCPLPGHAHDRDPSFVVYTEQDSYFCFGCRRGGDVITLVEQIEGLAFAAAVDRLTNSRLPVLTSDRPAPATPRPPPMATNGTAREALAVAVEFYANRLRDDTAAQDYLRRRGLSPATIARRRLGLGGGLADYLAWQRLAAAPFQQVGLLGHDGRERFAGRVTVPELVAGRPVWLTGRLLPDAAARQPATRRYESLPGPKPLLGLGSLSPGSDQILLVEGVFDWLLLVEWGFPALALNGAGLSAAASATLARFAHLTIIPDNDEAGRLGAARLMSALGTRARIVTLPPSIKDVGELAALPDGRWRLATLLASSDVAVSP